MKRRRRLSAQWLRSFRFDSRRLWLAKPRRQRKFETLEPRALLAITTVDGLDCSHDDDDHASDVELHSLFAPGTSAEYIEQIHDFIGHEDHDVPSDFSRFQASTRWGNTATDGGGLAWGDGTTITWSIAPDGTNIPGFNGEPTSGSNFVSFMNGIYGSVAGGVEAQPWFSLVTSVFDSWSEASGINFVYESNDDGASFSSFSGSAPGVAGVRGDIRVGGHTIDGNSGVLAYNFFPNNGEMVIDTADSFYSNTGGNSLRLRNVMAHELGHGLGISHVEPVDRTKLMEPFASTSFDGPQHDDILAAHRLYGDENEIGSGNDTPGTATNLGAVSAGTFSIGDHNATEYVSIDGGSDVDYFQFTAAAGTVIDASLAPIGFTYQQGPQGGSISSFNSAAQNDLEIEILNSGFTVIASADNSGLGGSEALSSVSLDAGGTYYFRVAGDRDEAQFYQLDVTVADGDPPEPPPAGVVNFNDFSIDPYGGGQDFTGTATVESGGAALRMTGNRWKKIDLPYTITPNTVIEFDFSSTSQGEIHGIGFDNNTSISSSRTFRVYGTQNWGIGDFDNYSGSGTTHYMIPVGQYYTGDAINLFFTNDHDVSNPSAVSVFSNIRVYEDVAPGPSAPTASDDGFTVAEDSSTQFNVTSNDDDGGAPITITNVSNGSAGGSISIGANQTINYQPATNFFGTETFNYTVTNSAGQSTATVSVNVTPVNDLPSAGNDSFTVDENSQDNVFNVLGNDSTSPDQGETLTITNVGPGSAGGTINADGQQITYTPAAGFFGTETFNYTVNDGTPGSNATATVTVTVNEVPDTLSFNDFSIDSYGGRQDFTGQFAVLDGGQTLRLDGNTWKKIDLPYTITSNTVIEFDFSSTSQGEIHGIGFDTNTSISSSRTFRIYGTQNWGRGNFDNYPGSGTVHYTIPVGQFYTGNVVNLFFVNDHDTSNPTAVSLFSNVRIYEANTVQALSTSTQPTDSASRGLTAVAARGSLVASASATFQGIGSGAITRGQMQRFAAPSLRVPSAAILQISDSRDESAIVAAALNDLFGRDTRDASSNDDGDATDVPAIVDRFFANYRRDVRVGVWSPLARR